MDKSIPESRDIRVKKAGKWQVKVLVGDPVILHPAECNFRPNILHLGKAEK